MTALHSVNERLSFSGQITADDLPRLAEQGYTIIVCQRPDGEEYGQPHFADINEQAGLHGITCIYAPVANSQFSKAVLDGTAEAAQSGKKTLMYCKSGMRSSIAYAITQVQQGRSINKVIDEIRPSGFDLIDFADFIAMNAAD